MSYVERIIIGAVLILSAYNLYTGAEERHQFHSAISQRNPPNMQSPSWSANVSAAPTASNPTVSSQWS